MTHPLHSDACKCECDKLAERIRTLHTKGQRDLPIQGQSNVVSFCVHCTDELVQEFDEDAWVFYPCATILALQGDDDD